MTRDKDELTILLTLKDRSPFTFRWMSYADAIRFPFSVLIADGGSDGSVGRVLSNPANFSHVAYEYVRYPEDRTYADYYAKVHDALSRIRTPFVAMADNDDLFVVNGLRQAVAFLCKHQEYMTCGGQFACFWVNSADTTDREGSLYGERIEWKYSSDGESIVAAATARERIRNQSNTYYHVQRTSELRRQFQIVRDVNLEDIFLVEHLLFFLTAIAGETKWLNTLYLARQYDSPATIQGTHHEQFGDWFGRMLVPSWSEDFTKVVNVAATELADADGIPFSEARAWVVKSFRVLIAPDLLASLQKEPTVRTSMSLLVPVVNRLINMPQERMIRKVAQTLYRRVRWISFQAVRGIEWRARHVTNAEQEFRPIREFLRQGQSSESRASRIPAGERSAAGGSVTAGTLPAGDRRAE